MSSVESDPEMELDLPFEADPFTDAPFKFLQTHDESVESAVEMSRSPTNGPPENVRPKPANILEWVDQLSLLPEPGTIIETRQSTSGSSTPTPDTNLQNTSGLLQPKAYGIETLLALGRSTPMENMELRVHPGALTG